MTNIERVKALCNAIDLLLEVKEGIYEKSLHGNKLEGNAEESIGIALGHLRASLKPLKALAFDEEHGTKSYYEIPEYE